MCRLHGKRKPLGVTRVSLYLNQSNQRVWCKRSMASKRIKPKQTVLSAMLPFCCCCCCWFSVYVCPFLHRQQPVIIEKNYSKLYRIIFIYFTFPWCRCVGFWIKTIHKKKSYKIFTNAFHTPKETEIDTWYNHQNWRKI